MWVGRHLSTAAFRCSLPIGRCHGQSMTMSQRLQGVYRVTSSTESMNAKPSLNRVPNSKSWCWNR
jgi:hypothetical protein